MKDKKSQPRTRSRIMTKNLEEEAAPAPDLLEERARELAVLEGRTAEEVSAEDYRRARAELSGRDLIMNEHEDDSKRQVARDPSEPAVAEEHRQTERHPVDESLMPEELAKQGMREAEHEEMLAGEEESRQTGEGPDPI